MEKYSDEKIKPVLFTCDDRITSFLDMKYDELAGKFLFFNAGSPGRITEFMNKKSILDIAEKNGMRVLKTTLVERGQIPDDIEYPIITKASSPNAGAWKGDVFICRNREDLVEAYSQIQSEQVLLQRYIEKENELCLDGFCINNGKDTAITIASDYVYLLPDKYSPYMNVYNFKDEELFVKIKKLFADIGFEGIFSIEFLLDRDGTLYFSEINFRHSTWAYASACAGMNIPELYIDALRTGRIDRDRYVEIPDGFRAMVEIDDMAERVKKQKMGLFKWIKEAKSCGCLFYLSKRDLRPSFHAFIRLVYIWIKKILHKK